MYSDLQDAVSAQQRSFARAMKKRQAVAQGSSAKSLSHSAGARLYDQVTEEDEDTDGSGKSVDQDRNLTNGKICALS